MAVDIVYFIKDPDSTLDYTQDWTAWLEGDTITSAIASAQSGLTVDSTTHTASTATVWVSGGTAGTAYAVTVEIETALGKTEQRSFVIDVKNL